MRLSEDVSVEKAVGGIDADGFSLSEDDTLEAVIDVRVADMLVNLPQNENHMREMLILRNIAL
jgi:hypothetical protein